MKIKIFFLFIGLFTGLVISFGASANFLSDWSNDDLCGWMKSTSIPEHIQDEVDMRKILCYGGIEVSALPESDSYEGENGTVFPSPDPELLKKALQDSNSDYSTMY
tara:strand:+ start:110 stop:427 length:318 start_codon:yes stop_codon:yes gene_type:complete